MAPVWAVHGDRYIPPLPCSGACVAGPDGAVLTKCDSIPAWILVSFAAILVFMAVCTVLEIRVDRVTKLDGVLLCVNIPYITSLLHHGYYIIVRSSIVHEVLYYTGSASSTSSKVVSSGISSSGVAPSCSGCRGCRGLACWRRGTHLCR